jgi:hypothetical protein
MPSQLQRRRATCARAAWPRGRQQPGCVLSLWRTRWPPQSAPLLHPWPALVVRRATASTGARARPLFSFEERIVRRDATVPPVGASVGVAFFLRREGSNYCPARQWRGGGHPDGLSVKVRQRRRHQVPDDQRERRGADLHGRDHGRRAGGASRRRAACARRCPQRPVLRTPPRGG